jgi:hypothetical protein
MSLWWTQNCSLEAAADSLSGASISSCIELTSMGLQNLLEDFGRLTIQLHSAWSIKALSQTISFLGLLLSL